MKIISKISSFLIPPMLLFYTTYMNYPGKPDSAADIVEEENSLLRNKTRQLQKMLKPLLDKEEYKERLERVERTCEKYGLRPEDKTRKFKALQKRASPSPERSLMHLKPFSLLYCWVHKAASTSWNKIFLKLAGKKVPDKSIHEAAAMFRPPADDVDKLASQSLLFMVVRHPFERLVSAYRDKFELGSKFDFIYLSYAADILKLKYSGATEMKKRSKLAKLPRPSFAQFIDYLLRTDVKNYNTHWRPYWLHCNLCKLKFDFFAKFETLAEDMKTVKDVAHLGEAGVEFPWANRRSANSSKTVEYFKPLGRARMDRLFSIYQIDFEMFSYSYEIYAGS